MYKNKQKSQGDAKYFKEVLNKTGVTLNITEEPNKYEHESSIIIRDIKVAIESHQNYPNNVPEFINGLKYLYFESKKEIYLNKALKPSLYEGNENDDQKPQECLLRVFLNVDCIQSEIISLLLDEVASRVVEDIEDTGWLRSVLAPLRCLPCVTEPAKLNEQLLQILDVATKTAQQEMLENLAEIIRESEHEETTRELVRIMNEQSSLTAAIIHCLSNLRVSPQLKEELQDRILGSFVYFWSK